MIERISLDISKENPLTSLNSIQFKLEKSISPLNLPLQISEINDDSVIPNTI